MPELPEAETIRRRFLKHLKGKKISTFEVVHDKSTFGALSKQKLQSAVLGETLLSAGRKGKYFWLNFSSKKSIVIHLGMTGWVEVADSMQRFGRILIGSGKKSLCFTDPRKFGRVWLCEEPTEHPRIKKLGIDCFLAPPSEKELTLIFQKRKAPVKALLLNQSLFAGIGNWIADEVLYQAGIAPFRIANSLSEKELATLAAKIKSVIAFAVNAEGDEKTFPKNWLFHYRWDKKFSMHPHTKKRIEYLTVGGRTTAWCPEVQG